MSIIDFFEYLVRTSPLGNSRTSSPTCGSPTRSATSPSCKPPPDRQSCSHVVTLLPRLVESFSAHRDPGRAPAMEKYMRDQFPFLGIPTPERRAPHPRRAAGRAGTRRTRARDVRPPQRGSSTNASTSTRRATSSLRTSACAPSVCSPICGSSSRTSRGGTPSTRWHRRSARSCSPIRSSAPSSIPGSVTRTSGSLGSRCSTSCGSRPTPTAAGSSDIAASARPMTSSSCARQSAGRCASTPRRTPLRCGASSPRTRIGCRRCRVEKHCSGSTAARHALTDASALAPFRPL